MYTYRLSLFLFSHSLYSENTVTKQKKRLKKKFKKQTIEKEREKKYSAKT